MDYRNGTDRLSAILDGNGIPIRKPEGPDTGFAIEPFALFAAKITSGTDNYLQQRHDEALRDDPEMARRMRNDVFLMSLMQERKLAVASLKWHLEVDDEKEPKQKAMKDGLTRVLRATPRLQKLFMYLLEAPWYGRYGSNVAWEWEPMLLPTEQDGQPEKRKSLRIAAHLPINGDKIVYGHDGTPSVTVYAPIASEIGDRAEFGMSNIGGRTLKLVKPWRERFIIHQHEIIDADFFDAEQADMMHGIGIRSVVYWMNWLRTEWLSNITDWCQRTGLGVRLWYYQGGNPTSKAGVKAAAERQTDKTNLLIPRFGDNPHEGVEYVDTSGAGAELLLKLIQHMEERIERYVIGQAMSGGQDEGNGLGGTGRAMLAADTKTRIVRFDANNLAETMTEDVVKVMQRWTYPEMRDVPCRFLFDVDDPDPQAMLSAAQTFIGLGGTVKEDDVRSALGFGKPQEGDATLGGQQPGSMPGMLGMPGVDPQEAEMAAALGIDPEAESKKPEDELPPLDHGQPGDVQRKGQDQPQAEAEPQRFSRDVEKPEETPPQEPISYGFCPVCGAKCKWRERRINGNDHCQNGHEYPSRNAVHPQRMGRAETQPEPERPKVKRRRFLRGDDGMIEGYEDTEEEAPLRHSWDANKHPRGHEGNPGQFAKKGEGSGTKVKEKEKDKDKSKADAKSEWDGSIDPANIDDDDQYSTDVANWMYYDEDGNEFPQTIKVVEADYDPDPDNPSASLVKVYRWESWDDDGGGMDRAGDWTESESQARDEGKAHAQRNHQEPPDEDEEEDEDVPEEPDVEEPEADEAEQFSDLTGGYDMDDAPKLVGAPEGATIKTEITGELRGNPEFTIKVKHPWLAKCERVIGKDREGYLYIENVELTVKRPPAPKGAGSKILYDQVMEAAANGFDYIKTHAGGWGPPGASVYNGYITWPKLGYDAPLEGKHFAEAREAYPEAETVLDIFETEGGPEWWEQHGVDIVDAKFDLAEGSRSRRVLERYMSRKSKGGGE